MKSSRLILGVLSIMTLCLAACGKPNMSFEAAVDNVFHSELNEIMNDADYYHQNFDISTKFSIPDEDVKANITLSTDSKNSKNSKGEANLALKFNASLDGEKVKVDGNAVVRQLKDVIYFKINSLDISSTDEYFDADELGINEYKGQRFSLNLNSEIVKEFTESFYDEVFYDFSEDFNIKDLYDKTRTNKLINGIKESLNNEGAVTYSGIYSQFNGYNAYKFSIDRNKAVIAFVDYFKGIMPDDMIDELMEEIEYEDWDELFEDFPFTSFEGYLVITGKNRVQIVIENIDIDDDPHTSTINATFGRDGYKLVGTEDGKDIIVLSAMPNESHYDINMKVDGLEAIKGTITPSITNGKINIDFDLVMKYEDYGDLIKIPLQGGWTWEKIPEFDVKAPKNAKDLMDNMSKNNYDHEYMYDIDDTNDSNNNGAVDYNDEIINAIAKCLESEDNVWTIYDDFNSENPSYKSEDVKNAVSDATKECIHDWNAINDMGSWSGDSSLKDGALNYLEKEIEYYQTFYDALPYLTKGELSELEKTTYDVFIAQLQILDENISEASENISDIQVQFAKKHGFDLEDGGNNI